MFHPTVDFFVSDGKKLVSSEDVVLHVDSVQFPIHEFSEGWLVIIFCSSHFAWQACSPLLPLFIAAALASTWGLWLLLLLRRIDNLCTVWECSCVIVGKVWSGCSCCWRSKCSCECIICFIAGGLSCCCSLTACACHGCFDVLLIWRSCGVIDYHGVEIRGGGKGGKLLGKRFWVSFTDSPSYFVSNFLGVNNTLSDTLVSLISYFTPRFLGGY